MTDEPKLLPCPFCGGRAEIEERAEGVYAASCVNLGCVGSAWPLARSTTLGKSGEQRAADAWNTRAPQQQETTHD